MPAAAQHPEALSTVVDDNLCSVKVEILALRMRDDAQLRGLIGLLPSDGLHLKRGGTRPREMTEGGRSRLQSAI